MNPKMVSLLREGFSINTLENLSESQINVLYQKLNEQKGSVKLKSPTPEVVKSYTDKGVNVEIGEEEVTEKSVSKKQHGLMGAAYSVEKGDKELKGIPKSYRDKVKNVVDSMSKKQVKDFAKTKTSKLPEKVEAKESNEKFIQKAKKEMEKKGTEGLFKQYCGGEVTMSCIKKGLKSKNPKIVKQANFAKNIGGYKGAEHNESNDIKKLEESILKLIESHLPPHTTKGELLKVINKKR